MPTVAQLAQRRAVTLVDLGDGVTVTVEYYPDRISPRILRQYLELAMLQQFSTALVASIQSEEDIERLLLRRLDGLSELLSTLIASWDLTEEEGGPMVALTPERLAQFGFPFLWLVCQRIVGQVQAGEAKGTTSRTRLNGSSPRKRR